MSDPVRLCLLNDHLGYGGTTLHGVGRYFLTLVPQLDRSRVEPLVTILAPRSERAAPFEEAGIPITFVPRRPSGLLGLLRVLRRHGTQVVHAQGYAGTTLARLAQPLLGLRVVLHSHEADDRYPAAMRVADRLLAGREAAALAVSEDARRFFEQTRGIQPGATRVVHNGVDLTRFVRASDAESAAARAELGVGEGAALVVTVTRFRPEKGNDVLLRALPTLLEAVPAAVVAFAGEGPDLAACRELGDELGVAHAVRFLGFRTDVARLLSAADVVAVPSRREGSPFSVLEALALGAPLVATRVGGLPEILEDGVSALLVPSEDPPALGAALARLATRPDERARLGAGARMRAADFDVRAHAALLMDLYESLRDGGARVTRSSR